MTTHDSHAHGERLADVSVSLSTPHVIVVRVRVDFVDQAQAAEVGLVIPRSLCQGDRPTRHALRNAAADCLSRLAAHMPRTGRQPARVSARIGGGWQPVAVA